MTDVAMIVYRLEKLAQYLEFLEKEKSLTFEQYVSSQAAQFAVERAFQLAIQVVVDIATHILSTSGNLAPDDYRDAILKLELYQVTTPVELREWPAFGMS